ncbi:MAG: inositol monophosphatase family protein [Chloroherpetonaceae bacterium]|nr:inositol monophosphatase [Chloroherpetonaceae bacterium]MCS7211067.1 inositol monophosphatase [Chloroherpetonaceae bacterium]MDW8020600.1 inositol monophosphatase family protein [Chloroherpetonaceae bacterium]MDW8464976.1 inositol monophosphatase family protein [Chloroherpetonaceae bacterium]
MTRELITAITAVKSAGKYARKNFGHLSTAHISLKDRNDFVTKVDKECEALAAEAIRKKFPYDEIMGEEGTLEKGSSGRRWIIDPIDGTLNFIHSLAIFCISVALMDERGELQVGAIYQPMTKELFTAEKGRGAYLNNRRIRVTRNFRSEKLLLATGFPYKVYEHLDAYLNLFKDILVSTAGIRRPGSAAIDLAYTACGRFDGFWEYGLKIWDIAAGALIVKEAGGVVTDFKGNNDYLKSGNIIATNGKIHGWLLSKVQTYFGTSFE